MSLVPFLIAWFIFTFGPGIAITGRLTRDLDPLRRIVIALVAGTAAAPLLINTLGRLGMVPAFPYLAVALGAMGLWLSRLKPHPTASQLTPHLTTSEVWRDVAAGAALVALAAALGAIVFAQRLESTPAGIILYGEYDTADITWYAAAASEASHTIPPMASYYSGHKLNAAYYPHLVFAMIHRFAKVPLLPMYFGYAWPTFLALSALAGFVLVRSLASRAVAALAVVLVLVGSDFSYLAVWFVPEVQKAPAWDYVLWPTNFLSPTMQILHYNTWGLALPLFFMVLYSIVRGLQTRARGWIVLSAFLLALLFEFRPFAWVVLMAAFGAAVVFAGGDRLARRHFVATAALGVLFTTPFIYAAVTLPAEDRRTRLVIEFFPLVKRMLIKTDLTEAFTNAASSVMPWAPLQTPVFLLMATIVFLAIGLGVRWVGVAGVWRAIRRRPVQEAADTAAWSLLGWCVVAGVAIPFVLATDPYVDTLNFYVTGLYVLWIFTASALIAFWRKHPRMGVVALPLAIALTLPSSTHYLERRWTDRQRPGRVDITAAQIRIADYLRNRTDPETTVVLHNRPLSPSLTAILAERRIVLGWDVTYSAVGGQGRLRDVNRFYRSSDGDSSAAFDTLGRYNVTHVIVTDDDDGVHPGVLSRLRLVMHIPGAALYSVPSPSQP
jgi:hypothetical protein